MTLRHAVALALVGWYLMVPPIRNDRPIKDAVDSNASLSDWEQSNSFETVEACNQARAVGIESARATLKSKEEEMLKLDQETKSLPTGPNPIRIQKFQEILQLQVDAIDAAVLLDRNSHSRCISSDDPRLKP